MKNQDNLNIKNNAQAEEFREFLLNLNPVTQFTFNYFGEISLGTIDSIVEKELSRKDKEKFFTFLNDKLIAYGFLTTFEKITKKHNCILGIVVTDSWQNKGYGKKICQHMIKTAWSKEFQKIWLTVHSDNIFAFKMYRSLGFEIEGIFMNDERINEKYRHIISMAIFKDGSFRQKERFNMWKTFENIS